MPRCPIIYDPQHTIFCVEMVTCIGRWWYRNWYLSIPYEAPGRPPNPGGWPNPGGAPNPPPAGPPKLGGGGGISSMRLPPPPGGGGSGGETTTETKENITQFEHIFEFWENWTRAVMENDEMLSFENGCLVFLSMSYLRIDSSADRGCSRVTPP